MTGFPCRDETDRKLGGALPRVIGDGLDVWEGLLVGRIRRGDFSLDETPDLPGSGSFGAIWMIRGDNTAKRPGLRRADALFRAS